MGTDIDAIKTKSDELTKIIGGRCKIYKQTSSAQQQVGLTARQARTQQDGARRQSMLWSSTRTKEVDLFIN
jgi:hypothetical protein